MSSEKNFFRRWLDGQVDWSAMLEQEKPAPKAENDAYKPRWDAESARRSMERGQIAYTVLAIVACIVFAAFMLLTVATAAATLPLSTRWRSGTWKRARRRPAR